jgi:hypothetical protein
VTVFEQIKTLISELGLDSFENYGALTCRVESTEGCDLDLEQIKVENLNWVEGWEHPNPTGPKKFQIRGPWTSVWVDTFEEAESAVRAWIDFVDLSEERKNQLKEIKALISELGLDDQEEHGELTCQVDHSANYSFWTEDLEEILERIKEDNSGWFQRDMPLPTKLPAFHLWSNVDPEAWVDNLEEARSALLAFKTWLDQASAEQMREDQLREEQSREEQAWREQAWQEHSREMQAWLSHDIES